MKTSPVKSLKIGGMFYIVTLLCVVTLTQAAPHWGTKTQLRQPDGSTVEALMFGDEFYGWYETPDGYTVVRNPKSGWYCYAVLSGESTLTSTSVRYCGNNVQKGSPLSETLQDLKIEKKTRPSRSAILKQRETKLKELNTDSQGNPIAPIDKSGLPMLNSPSLSPDDIHEPRIGAFVGITLLVDFSDDTATMAQAEIDNYLNQTSGYNGFGCNGSIREYYNDVSNGLLDYTNHVTAYFRAGHPKTYYTDPMISYGTRARELITEALVYLRDTVGFDFSTLSVDASNTIYAINCFYAGGIDNNWAEGLWPHSWSLAPVFWSDSVRSGKYQITNIGTSLELGTFAHENGHMLMNYPDLYDYGYESAGAGSYCLMAYGGNGTNPVPPCPYLRDVSGWETIVDVTFITNDTLLYRTSNGFTTYRYLNGENTPAQEYFLIESMQSTAGSRYASVPSSGLAIWHIDRFGSNDNEQMTCAEHYLVSIEQADGTFDLENGYDIGDAADLFTATGNDEFSDATMPDAQWWCATIDGNNNSHMRIYDISAPGNVMSFRISGAADLAVTHPASIFADSAAQSIVVGTGHANLVVNLNGPGIDESVVTGGSGTASFSVVANTPGDTLWVTVTGGGYRYRGIILVVEYVEPNDTVDLVMGFEDASLWYFITGTGSLSTVPYPATQGTGAMWIKGNGWQQIKSVDLKTTDINETSSSLKLDIFVGNTQPNPWWIGQAQMYINCPSAGIYNQYIGLAELTNLSRGVYSTVSFNLPANVMSALAGDHSDFSFSIALNTNPGSGPYYFDNMRF